MVLQMVLEMVLQVFSAAFSAVFSAVFTAKPLQRERVNGKPPQRKRIMALQMVLELELEAYN